MLASKRMMAFCGCFLKARKVAFFFKIYIAIDSGSKIMVPFLVAVWDPVFFSIVESTQVVSGEDRWHFLQRCFGSRFVSGMPYFINSLLPKNWSGPLSPMCVQHVLLEAASQEQGHNSQKKGGGEFRLVDLVAFLHGICLWSGKHVFWSLMNYWWSKFCTSQ